jgi:regulation of enolase protein 1 (concanavalin A-like superfamily)
MKLRMLGLFAAMLLVVGTTSATALDNGDGMDATTVNAISDQFSDTYADPAVIRGKDGMWYVYATSDPLHSGNSPFGLMHIARTSDFVDWEYLGTVFAEATRPEWATATSFLWAPDVRYVNGEYVLYYTVTDTIDEAGPWNFAIGAATAPTPAGPWTDSGGPVVAPRPDGGGGYFNTIDPALFVDDDGSRYLYFGGFHGGIWVTALDEAGLRAVGEPQQVAHADRYEGAYVEKRDGYYYLTASSANCCAGPTTGYSVYAGRSTSPTGPFVDHEGYSMLDSRVGGTQVIAQNGNRWVGVGHHAFITDQAGQEHILYHGIDRNNAWLNEPGGVNRRPTLIDRIDWIDGWPVARAGAGPSDGPVRAPATISSLGIDSADPASGRAFSATSGSFVSGVDETGDAGAIGRLIPDSSGSAVARSRKDAPERVRVEIDVRLPEADSFEVTLAAAGPNRITVTIDADNRELVVESSLGPWKNREVSALPSAYDASTWTVLTVAVQGGQAVARMSESGLGDVWAEAALDLRKGNTRSAPVTLAAHGGEAQVDNVSVVRAHRRVTKRVAEPSAGETLFEEQFDGDLDSGWSWVRPDDSITVADGALHWPLKSVDLHKTTNTGALLLRTPPEGEWIAETKLDLDLGVDTIRNYQQAGLVVRVDDDNYLRLGSLASWGTRQVEFAKEQRTGDWIDFGGHLGGPAAAMMWLRLHHSVNPDTGEHMYRSATSVDGTTWRWGATWTLPADTSPEIGLYAGGGENPPVTASFDYLTFSTAD